MICANGAAPGKKARYYLLDGNYLKYAENGVEKSRTILSDAGKTIFGKITKEISKFVSAFKRMTIFHKL